LAEEQVELSVLRRQEAHRALWPSVNLKGEKTQGAAVRELGTPDFTEQSYGVQASQPVFQGGRLYHTYRQATATWESEQAKHEKATQEVLFSVREATWNLAQTMASQGILDQALEDLSKEKAKADILIKDDLIPRQVYVMIAAQHGQALLAMDAARAGLESRLWQWTAALGFSEPPTERPLVSISSVTAQNFPLDRCLALAHERHPDLKIQKKTQEAAQEGEKSSRSLHWPKLSLNGSYGRSGGAFKSEILNLREDYQFGGKLIQYFGGSTVDLTGLNQRTSPKLGQTTRTQSKTVSANVGLWDSLRQRTERKEALVNRHQADVQWDRTRLEVDNGVRDAYARWKQAQVRVKIAENERSLADTDFRVSQIKNAYREIPLSERSVTRNKLAQADGALLEAQAAVHTAEAALSRAVGDPDLFQKKDAP
jgi:outer membrane protein TolC